MKQQQHVFKVFNADLSSTCFLGISKTNFYSILCVGVIKILEKRTEMVEWLQNMQNIFCGLASWSPVYHRVS